MNRSSGTNNWHESNATDGAVVVSKVVSPPEDPIRPTGGDRPTSVIMSATVRSTGLSSLFVRHKDVDFSVLKKIDDARFPSPEAITLDNFRTFTSFLDSLFICPGNPDLRFVQLCRSRKGFLRDIKGSVLAALDSHSSFAFKGEVFVHTVRRVDCSLLLTSSRRSCAACTSYRGALQMMSAVPLERKIVSKYTSNRLLRTPQLREKVNALARERRTALQRIRRIEMKIRAASEADGIELGSDSHEDVQSLMTSLNDDIMKGFPEGSFRRIFWEQQLKASRVRSSRGMRWHPLIIRWALNLYMQSGSAYDNMRSAGFIQLPSLRTLRDYTHAFQNRAGF